MRQGLYSRPARLLQRPVGSRDTLHQLLHEPHGGRYLESHGAREHKEKLLTRYGEGRHPSDLAHRMAKQPVAGHPAPQHHHPQRTSCQPSHEPHSWNRGSQHSGFLPCTGRVFCLCLPAPFLRLSLYKSQGEHIRTINARGNRMTSTLPP